LVALLAAADALLFEVLLFELLLLLVVRVELPFVGVNLPWSTTPCPDGVLADAVRPLPFLALDLAEGSVLMPPANHSVNTAP
jgi:hypothetical protein